MTSTSGPAEQRLNPKYATPCTRVVDPGGPVEHCGRTPTRRYINGHYCRDHAPNTS
jgi:hypothetical protein